MVEIRARENIVSMEYLYFQSTKIEKNSLLGTKDLLFQLAGFASKL